MAQLEAGGEDGGGASEAEREARESKWRAEVRYCSNGELYGATGDSTSGGGDVDWEHVRWRHLADWEAQYEPKPGEAGGKQEDEKGDGDDGGDGVSKSSDLSPVANGGRADGRDILLDRLRGEMEVKMMDILLEVMSRTLDIAEMAARRFDDHRSTSTTARALSSSSSEEEEDSSNDPSSGSLRAAASATAAASSTLPHFLDSINAITLTYRFERHDPSKFAYLRRVASDQTADIVRTYLRTIEENETETARTTAERVFTLQRHARSAVDAHSDRAKEIVVGLLDERITGAADEALDGALAVAQEKLDEAGARLDEAGVGDVTGAMAPPSATSDAVVDAGKAKDKEVSEPTTDANVAGTTRMERFRHAVSDGTKQLKHAVAEKGAEAKAVLSSKEELGEEVVRTLGGLIKRIMTRGVDGLVVSALGALDGLIETLAEAHDARAARRVARGEGGGGGDDDDDDDEEERETMREATFRFVEGVHDDLERKASADTGIAVKVIGATMSDGQLEALVRRLT